MISLNNKFRSSYLYILCLSSSPLEFHPPHSSLPSGLPLPNSKAQLSPEPQVPQFLEVLQVRRGGISGVERVKLLVHDRCVLAVFERQFLHEMTLEVVHVFGLKIWPVVGGGRRDRCNRCEYLLRRGLRLWTGLRLPRGQGRWRDQLKARRIDRQRGCYGWLDEALFYEGHPGVIVL